MTINLKSLHLPSKTTFIRWSAGVATVALLIVPIFFYRGIESVKDIGYLGYFVANYLGYGLYILPFLITRLNPLLLIIIGAFGSTVDEFFAWYFGRTTVVFENKSRSHNIIESMIAKHGLYTVFTMGVLPLPGFLYTIAGFVGGHYGIPYPKYFLAGFSGRLLRNIVYTVGVLYALDKTGWKL